MGMVFENHQKWNEAFIYNLNVFQYDYNLKIASSSWLDMQNAGHEAVVAYRKCPAKKQIRSNSAPRGFWFLVLKGLVIVSANIQEGLTCVIDTFAEFFCYYRLLLKAQ